MIGGVAGGRSTYGICFGVLSWLVEDGHAGDVDLSGLAASFTAWSVGPICRSSSCAGMTNEIMLLPAA